MNLDKPGHLLKTDALLRKCSYLSVTTFSKNSFSYHFQENRDSNSIPVGIPSSNKLPSSEGLLPIDDSSDININLMLDANLECAEIDDSFMLVDKLPFDEEMEVELKDECSLPETQFPPAILSTSTQQFNRKGPVSAGKQAGKKKLPKRVRQ